MKFVYTCEFTGGQIWGHLTLREDNHYLSPEMGRGEGGGSKKGFWGDNMVFRRNAKETSSRQMSIKTIQK